MNAPQASDDVQDIDSPSYQQAINHHEFMNKANEVRRKIPSPIMLQAFEMSARTLSFTAAAKALNLTQSAISHQILGLEQFLGVALFERVRQRLQLTSSGELLLIKLTPAMDALEAAILETIASQAVPSALRLGVVPTVASQWLIPRLGDFYEKHPGVTLDLVTKLPFNFNNNSLDAAINLGNSRWPGAQADRLMGEQTMVVCSPGLASTTLKGPDDLAHVTLLHLAMRPRAWAEWATAANVALSNTSRGSKFELFSMVAQAAVAGLGAAVLPRFLIQEELNSGKLVSPFGPEIESPLSYYLVYPPANIGMSALQAFREWLMQKAAQP